MFRRCGVRTRQRTWLRPRARVNAERLCISMGSTFLHGSDAVDTEESCVKFARSSKWSFFQVFPEFYRPEEPADWPVRTTVVGSPTSQPVAHRIGGAQASPRRARFRYGFQMDRAKGHMRITHEFGDRGRTRALRPFPCLPALTPWYIDCKRSEVAAEFGACARLTARGGRQTAEGEDGK
jgi:hypothetical protein